ncbi:unnamed protein product [Brassica rapa]|uniref:At2g35280-like TPR domain-containing protein n=2 Tax=Brassica TaxID=3705 RepID=A0A3P6CEB8_BRACM|nr:unnamed protein product [Brassica napus]CAG7905897.1 unnamed protein product [Brassica rapa]CDY23186.1 BnaA04g05730D [Brassica napus]VDD11354.1 unnamed protein product [Brassica rapa]
MGSENSVNSYIDIGDSSDYNDYSNSDPTSYFKNVSLQYFVAKPFKMLTKHARFKELCLENDNPEAHYIEGLLQYFVHKEKSKGLFHLRQSATLHNTNGMYLYGLLMLALGHYPKGSQKGIGDNRIACDGDLESMAGSSVYPGSLVNVEILEEPPLTNLQILNTSKEEPLTGTMYVHSLQ